MARHPKPDNPFSWFESSPEVIQMVVTLYVRFPLTLRSVEDLAFERGIDICHEGADRLTSPSHRGPSPTQ